MDLRRPPVRPTIRPMRRLVLFACLAVAATSGAQMPTWDGMVSSAKTAWKKTVEAGRPLAQRIAKEAPERFRLARKQAESLLKQADKSVKGMDLEHKKALATELWRVRGSLDLMALLDPQTLKMFGIDVPDLTKLRADVARQIARLRG